MDGVTREVSHAKCSRRSVEMAWEIRLLKLVNLHNLIGEERLQSTTCGIDFMMNDAMLPVATGFE